MKNFNMACLDDFFIDDKMAIDNVLTSGERQMIIKHAVDGIKANEFEKHIHGYEHIPLYHGQSIIAACLEEDLISNIYTLRDTVEFLQKLILCTRIKILDFFELLLQEYLKKLKPWYSLRSKWLRWQPLDTVRDYFGESVGIYFAFVGKTQLLKSKYFFLIFSTSIFYNALLRWQNIIRLR